MLVRGRITRFVVLGLIMIASANVGRADECSNHQGAWLLTKDHATQVIWHEGLPAKVAITSLGAGNRVTVDGQTMDLMPRRTLTVTGREIAVTAIALPALLEGGEYRLTLDGFACNTSWGLWYLTRFTRKQRILESDRTALVTVRYLIGLEPVAVTSDKDRTNLLLPGRTYSFLASAVKITATPKLIFEAGDYLISTLTK